MHDTIRAPPIMQVPKIVPPFWNFKVNAPNMTPNNITIPNGIHFDGNSGKNRCNMIKTPIAMATPSWNPVKNSPMYCTSIVTIPITKPPPTAIPMTASKDRTSSSVSIKYTSTEVNRNPVRNMTALKNRYPVMVICM